MRVEQPGGPDAVSGDPDRPVYQVNIFERHTDPDIPEDMRTYHVSEWKLHEADAAEVLAWASGKAAGRPYVVYVASADPENAYLIHLLGSDPNRTSGPSDTYVLAPDVVPDMAEIVRRMREGQ